MKTSFKTHNEKNINTNGTSLQGEINVSYQKLIELFGEPTPSDEYKSDAEWEIEFEDGTIATIYNWKNGKNYLGENGSDVEDIRNWHIGGFNKKAVELVEEIIN